jgi:hypothetical protein
VLESNWKPRCLMDFEGSIYAHPSRRHVRLPRASAAAAPSRVLHSGAAAIDPYVREVRLSLAEIAEKLGVRMPEPLVVP